MGLKNKNLKGFFGGVSTRVGGMVSIFMFGAGSGVGAAGTGLMRVWGVVWGWPWMVGFGVTGAGNVREWAGLGVAAETDWN